MTEKPNILIILADQLRRDALSVYGDQNIKTPNIDALAANGVRFDNACSTYPLCVPFRYSLMTGQYPHSCMIPALGWRMSPAERTLADEFNENGYETAYFGKWHLYGGQINIAGYCAKEENSKPVPRSHQGRWQYWRGFDLRNSPFDTSYYVDDDPTPHRIDGYQTDGLTDLAMNFIRNERDKSKPFCAVLSVEPPHPPYEAPEKLETKWLSRNIDLPPNFMVEVENKGAVPNLGHNLIANDRRDEILRERKLYYAMIENLDDNVGRIVHFLKGNDLLDNTVVIFMADHGELGGAHCQTKKSCSYEESIGIPLIVTGPGVVKDRAVSEPLSTEDLFPTILGIAGIAPQNSCLGEDTSPLIRNELDQLERPGVLLQYVWEPRVACAFFSQLWRGFRSQRYKYTVLGDFEQGLKPWQFFDLENDPYELNNLIENNKAQELVAQHHEWMCQRMKAIGDDAVAL